ncbi:MAG: lipid kinase [Firmicutes bacterium HGW-Firmicutes-12]|jgi:YegS/Rv2252/BmrU family lipid kinase|nr:MAG: lipid kinase [Firmicutes bacterium HGW-Firmicutes-12]
MRIKFIINPLAGRGRALELWKQIKHIMGDDSEGYQFVYTRSPGEATLLAKKAVKEKYDTLAVIGGDGTLNEVANGLVGSETALAVFPGGTGNDFAKTLGITRNPSKLIEILNNGKKKLIDIVKCNDEYFINMAGIGFDAEVAKNVNGIRFLRGEIAYISAILKTLLTYRPIEAEIVIDGLVRKEKVILVAVGNGEFVGGGIHILPNAILDDGLIDICIIKETTKTEILRTLPSVYKGSHTSNPKCLFLKGREVIINIQRSERQVYAQLDGQVFYNKSLHISVIPQAIQVLIPV